MGTYKGNTSSATIQLPNAYYSYSFVATPYYKNADTGGCVYSVIIHNVVADYSGLSNNEVQISVSAPNGYIGCN